MPTITPTRISHLRHALGRVDVALVAVIAAVFVATALIVAIGPVDALSATVATRCA
jgi:hypothetical protein